MNLTKGRLSVSATLSFRDQRGKLRGLNIFAVVGLTPFGIMLVIKANCHVKTRLRGNRCL